METNIQSIPKGSVLTSGAPPVAKSGTLGKFGSFWMPESPRAISQRAGTSHGNRPGEPNHQIHDKKANVSTKSSFRDVMSQKESPRSTKTQQSAQNPPSKPKAQSADAKGARSKASPVIARNSSPVPIAKAAPLNAKSLSPERVVADKHAVQNSSRRDLQDILKQVKTHKDRDLCDEQSGDGEEENRREHGAENAKHGRAQQMQRESTETTKASMNPSNRDGEETTRAVRVGVEMVTKTEVVPSGEPTLDSSADRFLRSDDQSQRDARDVFDQLRGRIGRFIDGEARVARIAVDLPGGGRLGIKLRFVGDHLEVIFATEDKALRAALLESWRLLSEDMQQKGSLVLPPAFARENYEGIVRSEWIEAA